jgi:peptide/nickel transport system ATP-binding protein
VTAERAPALAVEGLTVSFAAVQAVREVDLTVAAGEIVGLVGGSGVGKSTVARAIAGLVTPDSGSIRLDGVDLAGLSRRAARRHRQWLHLVFQDPYAALPPTLRVGDIVAEPLVIHRIGDRDERRERAAAALTAVHLHSSHLTRYPHQLSGGERQRVAFARALVTRPRLVLADEPTRMLDATLRREMVDLISELAVTQDVAILHITHDLALVRHGCTRVVVMQRGRVVEQGPTADVLEAPRHPYTAALVAAA